MTRIDTIDQEHSSTAVYRGTVSRSRQWSDMGDTQKAWIVGGGLAEFVVTSIALVDLVRRPADTVRGPKAMWALSFVVQPFGPLAYFAVGRKRV